ncbi:protein of unknown function [Rhodovastum atsumiense]|nr:protein of unknown function [Rhodovastum atsumiense]
MTGPRLRDVPEGNAFLTDTVDGRCALLAMAGLVPQVDPSRPNTES